MADQYAYRPRQAQSQAPHPQHYPEAVFINAQPQGTSVKNLSVPLLLAISGAAALVLGTWSVANQVNVVTTGNVVQFVEIKNAIEGLKTFLTTQLSYQDGRISKIEVEMERRTLDRYTRSQHDQFCAAAEILNKDIGWRCPGLEAPTAHFLPGVTGWEPKSK